LDYNLLEANSNSGTYQWVDCDNGNASIAGATGQQFTASANGNYAVIVTNGSCTDTSDCVSISTIGIDELGETAFSIFPNPTKGEFTVDIKDLQQTEYALFDATGRVVMKGNLNEGANKISITHLSRGTYTIELTGFAAVRSIVKL
jgi:hypothetical protein